MGKILVGFQRGGVNIPVCTGNACPGGDQAGGMGIVAGYDLHSHALTVKIAEGLGCLLPDAAAEQNQCRVQPAGDGVAVISGGQQHPAALLRPAVHSVPVFFKPLRQNEFRRANQKRALLREHRPAPLGLRGEGDALFADPVGFAAEQLVNGSARGVVRLRRAVHGGEDGFQIFRIPVGQGNDILHFHIRLGDGAGFVHAQHIHPRQRLDAVHVLHQHLFPAQLHRRRRHGDGGQQIQPLGDHPHQRRDGSLHAAFQTQLEDAELLIEQDNAHRHQRDAHEKDQPVQRAHHFRLFRTGVFLGFPGKLGGEGIPAHGGKLHPPTAGENGRAGFDFIPGNLRHRVGLAGEQRLVHPHFPAA